jgi:hypothetical protein
MMTWGISDFVDEKTGESDGKYSLSLNFPNDDYRSAASDQFLQKLKGFENQILDDAVKYSEAWFGEELSREVVKHNFFPFLKYSKDKLTKKLDLTKPPAIRARVPNYNNRWGVEIYDTNSTLLFPCDNDNMTPMDFVPKKSQVACVLQCGGLWFGGKGWGITWKLNQCVVKPQEVISVFGKCQIQLSSDEIQTMDAVPAHVDTDDEEEEGVLQPVIAAAKPTEVDDSDDEEPAVEEKVVEPVKKVIKKAVAVDAADATTDESATPALKKKVIKKKVAA